MKRKFKLFATVASLCLSVALMAFGVYAATKVTYTVSGSVSFSANVNCTWEVTATYGDGTTPVDTTGATASHTFQATDTTTSAEWKPTNPMQFGSETDHNKIIITVKCTNLGAQAITIGLGEGIQLPSHDNLTVTYNDGEPMESDELTTGYTAQAEAKDDLGETDVYTFTMTLELKDLTKGLPVVSFTLPFTASGTSV